MEITIRQAGINDLEDLIQWRMEVLNEVFGTLPEQDMMNLEQANRSYYQATLESDGHIACFACLDEIVGCGGICLYHEMPSPDNPTGLCAYLMNVYVRPSSRGKGVGEKIVRWLAEQAKLRGATKIYLETSESGRKLYRKIGFSPMEDYFQLKEASS